MSRVLGILRRGKALRWQDWLAMLVVTSACAMFIHQCIALGDRSVDDAFITFSYSKNLAQGHGPVYSHGVRVEGYSNFLWMVLMALPLYFTGGAAPMTAARVLGGPFVLLLGFSVYRFARRCGSSRLVAALCVLLLSFNTDLAVAYLTGMETLPYTALVTFALAAAAQAVQDDRGHKWLAWAGLAVALTRIDGLLLYGLLLGWVFLRTVGRRDLRVLWRRLLVYGPPVAVYLLWYAWRWHYYGMLFPSTYYAKSLVPTVMPMHGVNYVAREIRDNWLWAGLVGWLWLLWCRKSTAALAGCIVVAYLTYVIQIGGDWMAFGRFILPVVPLLVALFLVGAANLTYSARRSRSLLYWLVPLVAAVMACIMAVRTDHRFYNSDAENEKVALAEGMTTSVAGYLRMVDFLRKVVPPGGRLVTDYGGVFAYFTEGYVIEMWGLANATIATRGDNRGVFPFYGKTCPSCYPELEPEYFHVVEPLLRPPSALNSLDEVIANVWQSDAIGQHIDFRAKFTAGRVTRPATNEALFFLKRRDKTFPAPGATGDGFVIDYPFEPAPASP
jgi:arabinofuranosyltransferase